MEVRWINPKTKGIDKAMNNNIHYHIKQAITTKLCVERYAKFSAISHEMIIINAVFIL